MQPVSAEVVTKSTQKLDNLLMNLLHTTDHEQIQRNNWRDLLHNVYARIQCHRVVSRTEMCVYSILFF